MTSANADPDARPLGFPLDWKPVPVPVRAPLTGRRVRLRPVDPGSDAKPLYEVSHPPLGDTAIWTYLPDGPYENSEALAEHLAAARDSTERLTFTAVRLPEEAPQGSASYLNIVPDHGVIEIGHIWFGSPLQRTPAATEAVYLLAAHVFDDLGYRRLEWKCNALNQRSRRAAERFGFRFEGVFRQHMVVKGGNRDTAWYSITDADWPAVREAFQRWLADENFDEAGQQRQRLSDLMTAP
jgi:RimJ/RimL family protein N-acetyltransferase